MDRHLSERANLHLRSLIRVRNDQHVPHKTIDCQGLSCPLPVLRAKQALEELNSGEVLELIATDPGSVTDVPSWVRRVGHEFLGTVTHGRVYKHYIRRTT